MVARLLCANQGSVPRFSTKVWHHEVWRLMRLEQQWILDAPRKSRASRQQNPGQIRVSVSSCAWAALAAIMSRCPACSANAGGSGSALLWTSLPSSLVTARSSGSLRPLSSQARLWPCQQRRRYSQRCAKAVPTYLPRWPPKAGSNSHLGSRAAGLSVRASPAILRGVQCTDTGARVGVQTSALAPARCALVARCKSTDGAHQRASSCTRSSPIPSHHLPLRTTQWTRIWTRCSSIS